MKVAIIGAGISGLACAHELERYGIKPIIYEDLDFIGDREQHITATLNIADRPIKDLLKYYSNVCHINIQPINTIKKLTHNAPNKKVILSNHNFGHFYSRGKNSESVKQQLYSQLKNTKVLFNQKPDYKILSKEYDFVVVSTGLPGIAKDLNCWEELISGWIKGSVVNGDFDPNELIMWINRVYCKNGYAYLCPFDNKRASLILFVPYVDQSQLEYYWNKFLETEKIKYKIVEEFSVEHFSGYVYPNKVNNIYLIGGAGGALSPFLGFGQVNSIVMGVFAAQSIVEGRDFEVMIKQIVDKECAFYEIRKAFDNLTNNGFDRLLSILSLPGIKHIAYYTNLNVIKYIGKILKLINKINKKN